MGWRFNNTRIYANKLESSDEQIIARLQPLDTKTVHHVFGWESEKLALGGLVVTTGDMQALQALNKTGLSYTLSGPEGTIGNYYVKGIKSSRSDFTYIFLYGRPNISCTAPQYEVSLELYADD